MEDKAESDGSSSKCLPPSSSLSPSLRSFLDQHFKSADDLSQAPLLAARLSSELDSLEHGLSHLQTRILEKVATWTSRSQSLSSSLEAVNQRILELSATAEVALEAPLNPSAGSDMNAGCLSRADPSVPPSQAESPSLKKHDLVGELPILAGEVARVERVRLYAETALRLEALVGDLEDAVGAVLMGTPRIQLPRKLANSPALDVLAGSSGKLSVAMNALQATEDVVAQTMRSWPQWKRLFSAVDVRVDGAVATLRPSAVADYRSHLVAIRWPPSLSTASVQEDHRDRKVENPLLEMQGEVKARFEESFLALSTLQAVQLHRKARQRAQVQLEGEVQGRRKKAFRSDVRAQEQLWTVDELVAPIGSRAEYHFLKWSEKPDLIFGLAYRIAHQYINSVDRVLQPVLDRARLVGYCVRDEWVSALVRMVVAHLRSHALPQLAEKIAQEATAQEPSALWLHMVDLAITFDKRMHSLAVQSAGPLAGRLDVELLEESELDLQPNPKCISVFAERGDWLELWAQLELGDAQEKLRMELRKESAWLPDDRSDFSVGAVYLESRFVYEEYRAPRGAETTMLKTWAAINRCRSLPEAGWRLMFVRSVGAPLVKGYLADLLQRCQEAEAMTALAEEGAVLKVAMCINAAYYCEHKLQEWSEDIFFLDLRLMQILAEIEPEGELDSENVGDTEWETFREDNLSSVQGSVFDEEITSLSRFRADWLLKLVSAIQRAFDASCQEYQRNKKRWQDETTGAVDTINKADVSFHKAADSHKPTENGRMAVDIGVSPSLVDALAILQGRLRALKEWLGDVIFMDLWRSLASGLDQFFFNTVVLGGAKFSEYGSRQLARDVEALFQVFKPLCVRPASFFPSLSDAVLLLSLPQEDVVTLLRNVSSASTWRFREQAEESKITSLKKYGVRSINPGITGKILSHRLLPRI